MGHPAAISPEALLAACTVERTRRSGPGGQHRNKVETAIVLTHIPTGVRAEASERRSQAANLAKALVRLRVKLAIHHRAPPGEGPSRLWLSRISGRRIGVNPEHEDFPALLAESLDVLADRGWSAPAAAKFLNISTSQLVKFLKMEREAIVLVNARRRELNQPPLQ